MGENGRAWKPQEKLRVLNLLPSRLPNLFLHGEKSIAEPQDSRFRLGSGAYWP